MHDEKVLVMYSANNSGGDWWLTDEDWKALEKAGWAVEWCSERWLNVLATNASKRFDSLDEGIEEWREVTGADPDETGCLCCGPPHYFYTENDK